MVQTLNNIIFTDKFGFIFFEMSFLILFVFATYKDIINKYSNPKMTIKRGEKSREMFNGFGGILIGLILSIIFTITSYPENGKVSLYLINVLIVIRLCFYSSWFTNKLVSFQVKYENRDF